MDNDNTTYLGVLSTSYTPQVEGQLTRDLIAASTQLKSGQELCVCCEHPESQKIIETMGARYSPILSLPDTFLKYRTEEDWPKDPPNAETLIERDLWVPPGRSMISPGERPAYYLPPQGRMAPPSIGLKRPAPNGYSPVDPQFVMLHSNVQRKDKQ